MEVPPVNGIRDVNHKCYIQPNHKSKVGNKYVFFDFETDQSSGIHDVNYCIAAMRNLEQIYYILISPILWLRFLILKPDFDIKDVTYEELLKITQEKIVIFFGH